MADNKQKAKSGAVKAKEPLTKEVVVGKLFSANFALMITLVIGTLWVGFPTGEAEKMVQAFFSIISGIGLFRNFFKDAKIDAIGWVKNSNTWGFLSVIFIQLFPSLTPELFVALRSVVEAGIGGNWQQILTATIGLATIIWEIFKNAKLPKLPAAKTTAILMLVFFCHNLSGQTNRNLRSAYIEQVQQLEKDTFEILPQPGEFPQNIESGVTKRDGTRVLVSNWGAEQHKLNALRNRIAAECKNKVHIRVVDTAMDTDHAQLQQGKQAGFNYTTDARGIDRNGHGTHVGGIIFAQDFGIAFDLIKSGVLTFEFDQILGATGGGSFEWFRLCEVDQLAKDRARKAAGIRTVVSGSFGGNTAAIGNVEAAMKAITDLGGVYCIAAGNTGGEGVQYPGSSQYSITCASLDQSGGRSSYSTQGVQVWNAQPGRSIQSCWLNNQYATISGTSMATPFLSGVVAIAISKWGDLLPTYTAVKTYLAAVSRDIAPTGKDNGTGYGIALIEAVLNTRPGTVVPPTPPPTPPGDPVRPIRIYTLNFKNDYKMYWGENIPLPSTPLPRKPVPSAIPQIQRLSAKTIKANSTKFVTISEIELSVNSNTNADVERKRIAEAFSTLVFANRGLVLAQGSDFADAVYWSSYFAELLIYTQYKTKIPINITRITGSDNSGNVVTWTNDQLRHFPKN
jgi:hypothetical protein